MRRTSTSCPQCGQPLAPAAFECACGWLRPGRREAAEDGHCSYAVGSARCEFPGSIIYEGRRFCRWHFRCHEPRLGEAVIEESRLWREQLRKRQPVDEVIVAFEGSRLPGYLPLWQREVAHRRAVLESLAAQGLVKPEGESWRSYAARLREVCRNRFLAFAERQRRTA